MNNNHKTETDETAYIFMKQKYHALLLLIAFSAHRTDTVKGFSKYIYSSFLSSFLMAIFVFIIIKNKWLFRSRLCNCRSSQALPERVYRHY